MLDLLLELFVSFVLCGILVFFAFLSAPAEAGANTDDDVTSNAADGSYETPPLLSPHELPLYTFLSKYVSLDEDTPCGTAYRWLVMYALHYSAREVYSEEHLREWEAGIGVRDGQTGKSEDEPNRASNTSTTTCSHLKNNSSNSTNCYGESEMEVGLLWHARESPLPSCTPLPQRINNTNNNFKSNSINGGARRTRRRRRRGCPPTSTAPPTPFRHESAHWVNVILRWAAFLCLGGGTVTPEVWTDHLLYHTERMLSAVNASYAEKMRARASLARVTASQLSTNSQQHQQTQQHETVVKSFEPFHTATVTGSFLCSPFNTPKDLVRVQALELGAGLLGGPTREVRRPQLNTTTTTNCLRLDGTAMTSGNNSNNLSPSLSAVAATSVSAPTMGGGIGGAGGGIGVTNPPTSPTQNAVASATPAGTAGGNDVGSGAASLARSSDAAATAATLNGSVASSNSPIPCSHTGPVHNSAVAAASVFLRNSTAGLSSVLADVVSSVTTANAGSGSSGNNVSSAAGANAVGNTSVIVNDGVGSGDYPSVGTGAPLGVVLPRVEGDIISVEEPYNADGSTEPSLPPAAGVEGNTLSSVKANGKNLSSSSSPQQQPSLTGMPLRCFAIPLLYEDARFYLCLSCCLPLGALLPISLCVPPDVLTLDCAVSVRRIIFNGHLYAAVHGTCVELSFPVEPQFTAVIEVMPDHATGGGGTNSTSTVAGFGGRVIPGFGAARTPGHTFTAVNTTRNEVMAGRDSGSSSMQPPLPTPSPSPSSSTQFYTPRPRVYRVNGGGLPSVASTTTGTSRINARNEKVQEVVLLAVRRLIQSLTYPNVLAGQLVCTPSVDDGGGFGAAHKLSMEWQQTTAKLPLRL